MWWTPSRKKREMASKNQVLMMVLGVLAVLGFVLKRYVLADEIGEKSMFWIASASILTLVVAGFFLNRRKQKSQS